MTCALKIQCDFILNVKVTVFFFLLTPSDTEPADVTGMVVDSINLNTYKSMGYTVYSIVLRQISLIYVIGNLSNIILFNYVWLSCPRACLSDEWESVMILMELLFPAHPHPSMECDLDLLALSVWPTECEMCSKLKSEKGIRFQGLFMNKTPAHGIQEKKHQQIKAGPLTSAPGFFMLRRVPCLPLYKWHFSRV